MDEFAPMDSHPLEVQSNDVEVLGMLDIRFASGKLELRQVHKALMILCSNTPAAILKLVAPVELLDPHGSRNIC
jgi:hypothetical protein